MDELEPYSQEFQMSRLQRLRMFHNDLRREDAAVQLTYYSVTALAALAITALLMTAVQEVTHEPTYRDRLADAEADFTSCIQDHADFDQQDELKISFAFPDYTLSPHTQHILDQCREEHPMPQPTN